MKTAVPATSAKGISLEISELTVEYRVQQIWRTVLKDVNLNIKSREIHGIVGESGSGKSTLGLSILGVLEANGRISGGKILFDNLDLRTADETQLMDLRGNRIGFVPQNPMEALNPSLTVGKQLIEFLRLQGEEDLRAAEKTVETWLGRVQIADPEQVMKCYPHQLSGGMLQRVMIAMALSGRPDLIILDEPTTALDVTTQAAILNLFRELIREEEASALYISHDLGTVAELCDSVTVLYAGEVMESAAVDSLFSNPVHPYTHGLLSCLPAAGRGEKSRLTTISGVAPSLKQRSSACVFAPRCPLAVDICRSQKPPIHQIDTGDAHILRCWRASDIIDGRAEPVTVNKPADIAESEQTRRKSEKPSPLFSASNIRKVFVTQPGIAALFGRKKEELKAVEDVSIQLFSGETLGLVGESGSGKTTLARAIVALDEMNGGKMELRGFELSAQLGRRRHEILREIRMIFQNSAEALNPYHRVGYSISRTYQRLSGKKLSAREIRCKVMDILLKVGLSKAYYDRFPHQLSGGEMQRIAIARAFAADPCLIVADEPTSSLDVSVQAVILNLLKDLREEAGVSYLFISHDLEVIEYLSDRIAVMYLGEIIEWGSNNDVMRPPYHPYTEALLAAAPRIQRELRKPEIRLKGEIPSPRDKPGGCPFHTRCPRIVGDICRTTGPPVRKTSAGHNIRCHHSIEDLTQLQEETR